MASTDGKSRRGFGWPLQVYFVALALMFVVVGGAAGAYVLVQSNVDARQAATADASFAAQKAAGQIASGVDYLNTATAAAIANPANNEAIFANPNTCQLGYAPIGAFDTGHIEIMGRDGTVVCSSSNPKLKGSVYSGQSWLRSDKAAIFAPVLDPGTGRQVAVFAFPMGQLGWFVWFFDLAPVGPKLANTFGSGVDQLEFLVTAPDGKSIVTRSIDTNRWTGASLAGTPFAASSDPSARDDVNGTARWYATSPVAKTGWNVHVGADRATALSAASRLQQQELGIIVVGVLLTLLALAFVYRQVARPVTALSSAVRSSRSLDSPPRVPVAGPAEVAALGENINDLIDSLGREAKERESARHIYVQLFQGSPLPIIFVDAETISILEVNDAAAEAFGYTRDEFKSLKPAEFYVQGDESENKRVEDLRARRAAMIQFGPLGLRKKDGSIMRALLTTYDVDYVGRRARVSMLEDVTEKEKLEQKLHQAERLESLGQLAGGVAHDFNNLLAVILNVTASLKTQLDWVGDERDVRAQDSRDLDRIEKAAQSATRLTRQLLAFARREIKQPAVLDLNEQITGLAELLRRTLGSHIVLKTSLGPDLWSVLMDPGQLEQVVINLSVNARDAMPKGGTLLISTDNVTTDDDFAQANPGIDPGRHVRLQVVDSGSGMDKATLEHVFEPFFTTKPVGQGTGLGLATVYGIVKQVEGHVSIYSDVGVGTTVTILIPATNQVASPVLQTAPVRRAVGTGTVLVVEDYEDLRELFEEILVSAGYRVFTAPDGAAALELAREHPGEIDVLLTDIVMPNMLGPELAAQLKKESADLRVLFMSGHAQPALAGAAALPPGARLLQKPFMGQELLEQLRQVLAAPPAGAG
jgi:PAS domain S-box-containing protein